MPKRSLIRRVGLGLTLFAFAAQLRAETALMGTPLANVTDQHAAAARFLDDLAGKPVSRDGLTTRERMVKLASVRVPWLSRSDAARIGRSPYQANRMLAAMDVVAALGQASVGTSQQSIQAALLQKYAALLVGNSNASLAVAASALSQEAQAVAAGDQAAATSAAQQIQDIELQPLPAGYQPTTADQAVAASLAASTGYDWASMFLALGQAVLAAVMGFISGGPYGAIAGAAVSLITSAMSGEFTAQNTTLASSSGSSAAADVGLLAASASQGLVAETAVGAALKTNNGSLGASNNVLQAPTGAANIQVVNGQGVASTGALPGAVSK